MQKSEKADAMIAWFQECKLPAGPIMLNAWSTIQDPRKFVEQNIATMLAMRDKLARGIGVELFRLSYMRLYELKKIIEQQ